MEPRPGKAKPLLSIATGGIYLFYFSPSGTRTSQSMTLTRTESSKSRSNNGGKTFSPSSRNRPRDSGTTSWLGRPTCCRATPRSALENSRRSSRLLRWKAHSESSSLSKKTKGRQKYKFWIFHLSRNSISAILRNVKNVLLFFPDTIFGKGI